MMMVAVGAFKEMMVRWWARWLILGRISNGVVA
jgi:hypothetical protein